MNYLSISISVYMFIFSQWAKRMTSTAKPVVFRSLFAKCPQKSSIPMRVDVSQPRVGLTTINIHSSGAPTEVFHVFDCIKLWPHSYNQ